MATRTWIRQLFNRPSTRPSRLLRRFQLEPLEDRAVPATFTVTNLLDDGSEGSLRWAVNQANTTPGADTITFVLPVESSRTIVLTDGPLSLTDAAETTIDGGVAGVKIDGNNATRLFNVGLDHWGNTSPATVTLANLTLTQGRTTLGGGAIYSLTSTLTVVDSTLANNTAVWNSGGAIFSFGGTLTVTGSLLVGNTAPDESGGAIYSSNGELTVTDSTFLNNTALSTGGAIATDGIQSVSGSAFAGNSAMGGGAIHSFGTSTMANSTFVGNSAHSYGGGIFNQGTLTLTNSTLVGNLADLGGGGAFLDSGDVTLSGTLVAGNSSPNSPDVFGVFGGSNNLIGVPTELTLGQMIQVDADGKPVLADNGGPTKTVALVPGSPAIDAGVAVNGLTTDQRGFARPQFGAPDIGAFELTVAEAGVQVYTTAGVDWYLGPTPETGDRPIFYTAADGSSVPTDGFATQLGLAADGTILARNSAGEVYARTGSADDGIGTEWEYLNRRVTADGATWFLGAGDDLSDRPVYRWAAEGEPTWIDSRRAASLWLATDGTVIVATWAEEMYQRVGSAGGVGTIWRPLSHSLVVTTTIDEDDRTSDPGVGTGTSLREALAYANANPGADTITFDSNVFGQPTTITLAGSFLFTDSARTTIQGPDARLTIEASTRGRGGRRGDMFLVDGDAEVGMIDFNITRSENEDEAGYGSRSSLNLRNFLDNRGKVEIDRLNIDGFTTAIRNSGDLLVNNSMITGSTQSAVVNFGNATVSNSTVASNSGRMVGGIDNYGALTVTNSTIAHNTGPRVGGIRNLGTLTVTNSTVAGNTGLEIVGGIYNYVLFVDSGAKAGPSQLPDQVGTLNLNNSIVLGNTGGNYFGEEWAILTGSHNLIDGDGVGVFATDADGKPVLADNGGPTKTIALVSGSPAIAGGVAISGVTTDQRGRPRKTTPDIGAFETQATTGSGTIQGIVYVDFNNNGLIDFGEVGIANVKLTLTGTDYEGNPVYREVFTDEDGIYLFGDVPPSDANGYILMQTQPTGWRDGLDTAGTIDGSIVGTAGNDVFTGLVLGSGKAAINYNFGERPADGSAVGTGDTAGIGFWHNVNGQNLIKSLNGGPTATQLGNWLAATFPNLYASLAGKTNAEVAAHYSFLLSARGRSAPLGPPQSDAQVMATALAVYVTNSKLAGTTAAAYGFNVTEHGTGVKTFNVGSNGTAFGVANNTSVSVLDLLFALNDRSKDGVIYDQDGNGKLSSHESRMRTLVNNVFSAINAAGGR